MKFWGIFFRTTLVFALGFAVALICMTWLVSSYFRTMANEKRAVNEQLVEIPYGSSLRRVAHILHDAGVIEDPRKFYWYLRLGRSDSDKIQAGYYQFVGEYSHEKIADRLLFGQDRSFSITFREGETIADLARLLENAGLVTREEFFSAVNSDEMPNLVDAPTVEGYLFPDTYFFAKSDTAIGIVKKMHRRLMEVARSEIIPMAGWQDFLHRTLTLASIIEKETGDPTERSKIASVYHNRLRIGMRLQADPTVVYGIKNYDGKITKNDLQTPHPYNTYKIRGLPPGPIASCGLHSIRAALKPEKTKYLYFVSRNDGTHEFCENLSCHNKAVQKWQINYFKN